MPKTIIRIVCSILIMLVIATVAPACAQKPEPAYADPITESILWATNENDYAKYCEYFDEVMKNAVSEAVFNQNNTIVDTKIGDYISKEFWKVENKGQFTIVYYKAKFTQEPGDVIVKVVFREIAGKVYVSGLWFDSPKLRGR